MNAAINATKTQDEKYYTGEKLDKARYLLVMLYAPATFEECLVHAYDSWQERKTISKSLANQDTERFYRCLRYARNKLKMAVNLASASKKRSAKKAILEAKSIEHEIQRLEEWAENWLGVI